MSLFGKSKKETKSTEQQKREKDAKLAMTEQMMNQPQLRTMGKDIRNPMSPSASNVLLYQIMKDD